MFLVVDNMDSFVWNLVRYLQLAGARVDLLRNDRLDFSQIAAAGYQGIILSPGPGRPAAAGRLLPLIEHFRQKIPILGVCLGHQAIAEACGARIICAGQPMHGKLSRAWHDGQGIFRGLPSPLLVTRYHSLAVDSRSLPPGLQVSCTADDGTIMGLRHSASWLEGVQFHPEAELTEHGRAMIATFVGNCLARNRATGESAHAAAD